MCGGVSLFAEYAHLFEVLESHHIRFCLLRDDLSSGSEPADLDILVDDHGWDRTPQLLQAMGYRLWRTGRLHPSRRKQLKWVQGKIVTLDVHRKIIYGGLVYLDHQLVLARRRKVEQYYLPSETDLLMILLFHNILGKQEIQDKHYDQIKRLAQNVDKGYVHTALKKFGTETIFFTILRQVDQIKSDQRLLLDIRRSIYRSTYQKNPSQRWDVNSLRVKRFLFRMNPKRRGFLMSCVGVDGAGKSSLAEALRDVLVETGRWRASVEYMGPWGHYRLKILSRFVYDHRGVITLGTFIEKFFRRVQAKKLSVSRILRISYQIALRKKLSENDKALHAIVRENSRLYLFLRYMRSGVHTSVFFALIALEMYLRYFRIYRRLRRGEIVVTDRYIYDLMVGSMHEVGLTHKRIRTLLCAVFFRPDRVFLLRNTPEQVLARKNQLTATDLDAIQSVYDGLARKYDFIDVLTDDEPRSLAQRLVGAHFDSIIDATRI